MILCTKNSDALVRSAVNKDQRNAVSIIKYQDLLDKLMIDPSAGPQTIDAFIITNLDIRNKNDMNDLYECLGQKHPAVKVIFINKNGKPSEVDGNTPGIDYYFIKPKPMQLRDAIYAVAAKLTEKPVVESAAEQASALKPSEQNVDVMAMLGMPDAGADVFGEEEKKEEDISGIDSDEFDDIVKGMNFEQESEDITGSTDNEGEFVKRIRSTRSVGDLAGLMRETNAEEMLKQLAKENRNYGVLEEKVRTLRDRVNEIMYSNSGLTLPERYEKARAVLYDTDAYTVKSNTMVEEYLREIFETITKQSEALLTDELERIQQSIKRSVTYGAGQMNFGKLAGLNEERGNAVLAMKTIESEIIEIGNKCADILDEIIKKQCEESENITESQVFNAQLNQMGAMLRSGDFIQIIRALLELAQNVSSDFIEYTSKVKGCVETMRVLLQKDNEQIAAMSSLVKLMKQKNVTDSVVANTLLKKSLRVFIARENTGRTIIPYALSAFKSRENANVLYLDLTGTSKLSNYGIKAYTLEDYKANRYEEQLCVVEGVVESIDDAQQLTAILTRAADYYRVINVVLSPENKDVIDIISADVLCINILTDTNKKNMEWAKQALEEFKYDNVARRIICNKCTVSMTRLCSYLEMFEVVDVQILSINHLNIIEAASYDSVDPTTFTTVAELLKEVRRYA